MTGKTRASESAAGLTGGADACLREGTPARERLLEWAESGDRQQALFLDPGLAAKGVHGGDFSDREIEDLKKSVLQARRLKTIGEAGRESASNRLSGWAVALTVCLLFLLPSSLKQTSAAEAPLSTTHVSRLAPAAMTHSSVEALDLPGARVYELAEEDFSLVLVVDESFEL